MIYTYGVCVCIIYVHLPLRSLAVSRRLRMFPCSHREQGHGIEALPATRALRLYAWRQAGPAVCIRVKLTQMQMYRSRRATCTYSSTARGSIACAGSGLLASLPEPWRRSTYLR